MQRRKTLALLGTALFAPGCLEAASGDGTTPTAGGGSTGDDCEAVDRPEPDPPDAEDAVAPVSYPDPPESRNDPDVSAYVEAFERAYRRNGRVQHWGDHLVDFGLSVHEVSTEAVADGGTIVDLRYAYWEEVEDEDGLTHGDSPQLHVVYYVDGAGARRVEDERPADEAAPDPRSEGDQVACFE